jgi:small subunit ribosomal protein S17
MALRELSGLVVSDKRNKTLTVKVERRVKHPVYKKIVKHSKKYSVHDPESKYHEGDLVRIVESRPFSKTKTWCVIYPFTDF